MLNVLLLFLIPLISAAAVLLLGRGSKPLAVTLSTLPLILLAYGQGHWIGSEVTYSWFPALDINFHLRVDALSLIFLYLVVLIIPLGMIAIPRRQILYPSAFYALVLLLQALLIGFFTAADLVLFTVFWESMLLPIYFLITLFGGPERRQAALKFLIYMIAGSVLMVAGILALNFASTASGRTFNIDALALVTPHLPWAMGICGIFLLAFAVKTPLFPFHGWLPEVYDQASTSGTIFLAALLSKAGIYGFFRIGGTIFAAQMAAWNPWLLGLAIAGALYGAMAAWQQNNFKRIIAYSSLSHVNFILVGIFVWSDKSHLGALLQALNHGITITALFLAAAWLKERIGSTSIGAAQGVAKIFPQLCWLTLLFVLSSIALPGTNNFVGEFLIFLGFFGKNPWLTAFLGLTVILSAVYMLRWMQKVYFGELKFTQNTIGDITVKELAIALPLVIMIFWIGIYPMPMLKIAQEAVGGIQRPMVDDNPKEVQT